MLADPPNDTDVTAVLIDIVAADFSMVPKCWSSVATMESMCILRLSKVRTREDDH